MPTKRPPKPKKGHRRQKGDTELVADFLDAIQERGLSTREAAERTGISHGTIARYQANPNWTGMSHETRRRMRRYLERSRKAEKGRTAELELVAGYLERIARELRRRAVGSVDDKDVIPIDRFLP